MITWTFCLQKLVQRNRSITYKFINPQNDNINHQMIQSNNDQFRTTEHSQYTPIKPLFLPPQQKKNE